MLGLDDNDFKDESSYDDESAGSEEYRKQIQ